MAQTFDINDLAELVRKANPITESPTALPAEASAIEASAPPAPAQRAKVDYAIEPESAAPTYDEVKEEYLPKAPQADAATGGGGGMDLSKLVRTGEPAAEPEGKNTAVGNMYRAGWERTADLGGNLVGLAASVGGNLTGDDYPTLRNLAKTMVDADFGVDEAMQTTLDQVKEADIGVTETIARGAMFGVEQLIQSVPDMAAMMNPITLTGYLMSRTEEIAQEAAANEGREGSPEWSDLARGAGTAAIVTVIDKMALNKLLPKGLADRIKGDPKLMQAVATAAKRSKTAKVGSAVVTVGREAGTEAIQEAIEYGGASVGTEKGANWQDAGDAMLGGALGGVAGGAILGGGNSAVNAIGNAANPAGREQADLEQREDEGVSDVEMEGPVPDANASAILEDAPEDAPTQGQPLQQVVAEPPPAEPVGEMEVEGAEPLVTPTVPEVTTEPVIDAEVLPTVAPEPVGEMEVLGEVTPEPVGEMEVLSDPAPLPEPPPATMNYSESPEARQAAAAAINEIAPRLGTNEKTAKAGRSARALEKALEVGTDEEIEVALRQFADDLLSSGTRALTKAEQQPFLDVLKSGDPDKVEAGKRALLARKQKGGATTGFQALYESELADVQAERAPQPTTLSGQLDQATDQLEAWEARNTKLNDDGSRKRTKKATRVAREAMTRALFEVTKRNAKTQDDYAAIDELATFDDKGKFASHVKIDTAQAAFTKIARRLAEQQRGVESGKITQPKKPISKPVAAVAEEVVEKADESTSEQAPVQPKTKPMKRTIIKKADIDEQASKTEAGAEGNRGKVESDRSPASTKAKDTSNKRSAAKPDSGGNKSRTVKRKTKFVPSAKPAQGDSQPYIAPEVESQKDLAKQASKSMVTIGIDLDVISRVSDEQLNTYLEDTVGTTPEGLEAQFEGMSISERAQVVKAIEEGLNRIDGVKDLEYGTSTSMNDADTDTTIKPTTSSAEHTRAVEVAKNMGTDKVVADLAEIDADVVKQEALLAAQLAAMEAAGTPKGELTKHKKAVTADIRAAKVAAQRLAINPSGNASPVRVGNNDAPSNDVGGETDIMDSDDVHGIDDDVVSPTRIDSEMRLTGKYGKLMERLGLGTKKKALDKAVRELTYGLEDGGVSMDDMLTNIIEGTPTGHPYNVLARQLRKLGLDTRVVLRADLKESVAGFASQEWILNKDGSGKRFNAGIGINPNMVQRATDPNAEPADAMALMHTLLHEAVHIATVHKLSEGGQAARDMSKLFAHTQAVMAEQGDTAYGLKNVFEFVAEAMTNPEFQTKLNNIDAPAGSKMRKAWGSFMQAFKKMLRMQVVTDSVFDQVLRTYAETTITEAEMGETMPNARQDNRTGNQLMGGATYLENLAPERTKNARKKSLSDLVKKVKGSKLGTDLEGIELNLMAFSDIVDRYSRSVIGKTLKAYQESMRQRSSIVTEIRKDADAMLRNLKTYQSANPDMVVRFKEMAVRATELGLDPTIGFNEGTNARHSVVPKTKKGVERKPATFDAKVEAMRANHAELVAEMNATGSKKMFTEMRNHFSNLHEQESKAFVTRLLHTYADKLDMVNTDDSRTFKSKEIQALSKAIITARNSGVDGAVAAVIEAKVDDEALVKELVDNVEAAVPTRNEGPYIPLRRYGSVVTTAKRITKLAFATRKEAVAAAANVRAGGDKSLQPNAQARVLRKEKGAGGSFVVEVTESDVQFHESQNDADAAMAAYEASDSGWAGGVFKKSGKNDTAPTGEVFKGAATLAEQLKVGVESDAMKNNIDAQMLKLASINASKSSQNKRAVTGTGASLDLDRVLAERSSDSAWLIADLTTMADQYRLMSKMRSDAQGKGKNGTELTNVVNHLKKREEKSMQLDRVARTAEDALVQLGFFGFLASPSYAVVNASQVPLVTFPYLAGKYGLGKATKVLLRNWGESFVAGKGSFKNTIKSMPEQFVEDYMGKNPDNMRGEKSKFGAIAALVYEGAIDATFIQELQNAAKGQGDFSKPVEAVRNVFMGLPQLVEQINRVSTAGAAYELEMGASNDHAKALSAARAAVYQTQFDYSQLNAPLAFKSLPYSRVIFMFKKYSQGMYSLLIRNTVNSFRGPQGEGDMQETVAGAKERKRVARRTLTALLGMHTMVAGVAGGVMVEPIKVLANIVGSLIWDDDEPNWEDRLEELTYDVAGQHVGEAIMHGLPRLAGFDMSSRVGLDNLAFMETTNYSGTMREAIMNKVFGLVSGPLGSAGLSIGTGAEKFSQGNHWEGIEQMMPKGVRDLSRSIRRSSNEQLTASGRLSGEQYDVIDTMWQAAGFTPAAAARGYEKRNAVGRLERGITARKSAITNRWYRAGKAKRDAMLPEIRAWNKRHPYAPITGSTLRSGLKKRAKDRAQGRGAAYTNYPATWDKLKWTGKG